MISNAKIKRKPWNNWRCTAAVSHHFSFSSVAGLVVVKEQARDLPLPVLAEGKILVAVPTFKEQRCCSLRIYDLSWQADLQSIFPGPDMNLGRVT